MPPVRSIGRTVTRPHASVRGVDPAADLAGLEAAQWEIIDREMRQTMLISIDTRYKQYLDNFYETSKLCVRRHDGCVRNHRMWRYIAIIGTGVLACVNILAARRSIVTASSNVVPILASILALLLAVLANLETLANSAEKAQAYRESRELYLDAARSTTGLERDCGAAGRYLAGLCQCRGVVPAHCGRRPRSAAIVQGVDKAKVTYGLHSHRV